MVKEFFEQLGHALIGFIPMAGWLREGWQMPCETERLPVVVIDGDEYWAAERVEDMYLDFGGYAVYLEDRNTSRYPTYHRLDVSARKTLRKSWGTLVPYVDLLNVYNRRNVLFYFYQYDETPPVRSGVSMFPLIPTVGLEVSF